MPMIPSNPHEITVQWLNEVLADQLQGAAVSSVDARKSDSPGQTADIIIVKVNYDKPIRLPTRLIAKVATKNPEVLDKLIANYDQYRRETSFYREFPDSGIAAPRCLHQDHDPSTQQCVILMEDLAPAQCPSWAISPAQTADALRALPAFHAKWWNDPVLRTKDWLVQFDEKAFFSAAFGAADRGAAGLDQWYADPKTSQVTMSIAAQNVDKMMAYSASRPFTFVHGDYHPKQMFFPSDNGGRFAVIDWQFPFVAQGAWDFARMLCMALSADDRRAMESALVDEYHVGLIGAGVQNYSRAQLEDDIRYGIFISNMVMCIAHGDTDVGLFQKECGELGVDWRDAMLLRGQAAAEAWGVVPFLESIAAG